jgi:serine/threonine protein phosphatase 1
LRRKDQIFFLGDYTHRDLRNKEVLDLIQNMIDEGYNIYPLRGNHEQMLLDAELNYQNSRFVLPGIRKPAGIYDESYHLVSKYADFLRELPYYYELDSFILVHAGLNTSIEDPFEDTESMIWIDRFDYDTVKLKGKHIIHGHTPIEIDEIIYAISNSSLIIPLDNGINELSSEKKGNLLCLDLDKMELTIQKNIDK